MKKILFILILSAAAFEGSSQTLNPFPTTDSLRKFINKWIRNSAVDAFTNLRLNTSLIGMSRFLDSAYGGQVKSFSALNDSAIRLITIGLDTMDVKIGGATQLTDSSFIVAGDTIVIRGTGGGSGAWGGITGTLSDQTDLQAALDAKASGSVINNTNTGSSYRVLSNPSTQTLRTITVDNGVNIDSITNAGALTISIQQLSPPDTLALYAYDTIITALWPTVSDALFYEVQYDTVPTFDNPKTTYEGRDSFTIKNGFLPLKEYYYRVRARNSDYYSSEWMVDSITTGTANIDLISGQVAIWDISDAATLTINGGNLEALNDKGSGNNDITIGTAGNRPAYAATGGSGNKPFITVASGKTFGVTPFSLITTPFVVYIVCQLPNLTNSTRLFSYLGNNGENGPLVTINVASPKLAGIKQYNGVGFGISNLAAARLTWMVLKVITKNSGALGTQVNDEPQLFGDGAAAAASVTKLLCNQYPDIKISEVRVFDRLLPAGEDQSLRDKLIAKYAITPPAKLLIAFGDSHTAGVMSGTTTTGGSYMQRVSDSTTIMVYNYGASGSVVNYKNYPQTPGQNLVDKYRLYNLAKWQNYYVQFQYGTNDGAIAFANGTDFNIWKADYKSYIQSYIDAGFSPSKLIICTPPYSTGTYPGGYLPTIVTKITEIASELGIQLCDFYGAMQSAGLDIQTVPGGDLIHGNTPIHHLLFNTLKAITGL